ncbi:MAG: Crp/Fnr family transcriptional regulator [Lactobacillaceae bacterium]|nr:Crp/Fnr family transcriptional regulator [Lactobacillaceae bacterium]
MIKFLRTNKIAMWILTVLRVYLGIQWTLDGWAKLTMQGGFRADSVLQMAISKPVTDPHGALAFPWYDAFLKTVTSDGKSAAAFHAFSFAVSWGELLVGLGLVFGTLTLGAAFFGLVMNFSYLGSGIVSVNPTYIFIEALILIGGYNSAKIGLDYWVTPKLRAWLPFLQNDIELK